MSSLVLSGDTSGSVTLTVPAIAGLNTMTLVAGTGPLAPKVLATAVNPSSGSTIEFINLPSWTSRITALVANMSLSAASQMIIQFGTGTTPTWKTSGYNYFSGYAAQGASSGYGAGGSIAGAPFYSSSGSNPTSTITGKIIFDHLGSNLWQFLFTGAAIGSGGSFGGGYVQMSDTVSAVRFNTVGGTSTFSVGTANILCE